MAAGVNTLGQRQTPLGCGKGLWGRTVAIKKMFSQRMVMAEEYCAQRTGLLKLLHYALEHLTLEMLAYGRQKPAYSHFVARIFRKILAEHLTHFIRKLL